VPDDSPVLAYDNVDASDIVDIKLYVPSELALRYTLYPVAKVTEDQFTVILLDDAAVAVTPDGVLSLVVAEVYDD